MVKREADFLEWLNQFQSPLRRLCAAYLPRVEDQHDLFQEVALALWKALPSYRGDASRRTFFYRIAHNTALTFASRVRSQGGRDVELPLAMPAESADERLSDLLDEVRKLPALDRHIALLYLEGFTAAESETITGISAAAVAVRLTRIRQKLTEKFRQPTPEVQHDAQR